MPKSQLTIKQSKCNSSLSLSEPLNDNAATFIDLLSKSFQFNLFTVILCEFLRFLF